MKLSKYIGFVVLFCISFFGQAQEDYIAVFGSVKDERSGKKLEGVNIKITRNGEDFQNFITPVNGKFEFDLNFDYSYNIYFEKGDYVTKFITIDAKDVHPEDKIGGFGFDLEMALFQFVEGVNFDILKQPIGIAKYSRETGDIAFDYEYTRSIQAAIAKLRRELERKIRENNEDLAASESETAKELAKKEKFEQLIVDGDEALKNNQVTEALAKFEEAEKLYPDNPVVKNKINSAKRSVEEYEKLKKDELEYQKFVREADRQLNTGNYQLAVDNYQRALGVKPQEVYPKAQIDEINQILKQRKDAEQAEQEKSRLFAEAMVSGAEFSAAKNFESAIGSFEKALTIIPGEPTAEMELARAQQALADQKKKAEADAAFADLMAQGASSFAAEDYEAAEGAYAKAVELKSGNAEAIAKLSETRKILEDIRKRAEEKRKREVAFQEYLEQGDKKSDVENFEGAIESYTDALELFPESEEAQAKMATAKQQLDVQNEYAVAIRNADEALANSDFEKAKVEYTAAQGLKPNEAYPTQQLNLINQKEAEVAAVEQQFQELVKQGDEAFATKDWNAAKNAYTNALNIKPGETYPQQQIEKVLGIEADEAALETAYNKAMENGNQALNQKEWDKALQSFQTALSLKANDAPAQQGIDAANLGKEEQSKQEALQADFDAKLKAGREKEQNADLSGAQAAFNEALAIIPNEPQALEALKRVEAKMAEAQRQEDAYNTLIGGGDDAFAAKNYTQSIEAYTQALEIKPGEAYPTEQIAKANEAMAAEKAAAEKQAQYDAELATADAAFEAKDWDKATNSYNTALGILPGETYPQEQLAKIAAAKEAAAKQQEQVAALIQQGSEKVGVQQFDAGIALFNEALGLDPSNAEIPGLIENAQQQKSAFEQEQEAERQYNEAVAEGESLLEKEDFDNATAAFNKALFHKPEDAYAAGRIRDIELRKKEIATREAAYSTAFSEGQAALDAGAFDQATASFTAALDIKPQDPEALGKLDEVQQAKREFEELEADKAMFRDLMTQAEQKEAENDLDLAIELYEQASAVFPNNPKPTEKAAALKLMMAEKLKKEEAFNAAMQQGEFAFTQGDFEAAVEHYGQALTLFPNSKPAEQKRDLANAEWEKLKLQRELDKKYQGFVDMGDQAMANKDWKVAIDNYNQALGVKPGEMRPQTQIEKANSAIQREQEMIARADEFYRNGEILEEKYEFKSAVESFQNAVDIVPDIPKYSDRLIVAQQKLADWEEKRKSAERKTSSFGDVSFYEGDSTDIESELEAQERKRLELEAKKRELDNTSVNGEIVEADLKSEVVDMEEKRRLEEQARLEESRRKIKESMAKKSETTKAVYHTKPTSSGFRAQLAQEYPVGITEEVIEEPNRKIIKRVVVQNNEGDEFLKIVAKWGTYFFKNGRSITEDLWKLEAF